MFYSRVWKFYGLLVVWMLKLLLTDNKETAILFDVCKYKIIDRVRLAEKSVRKDEKTLSWPPPTSLVWLPNQRKQNSAEITNN